MNNITLDWFAKSLEEQENRVTLEEIISIVSESSYHPQIAHNRLMKRIDDALDRKDEPEFIALTNILNSLEK